MLKTTSPNALLSTLERGSPCRAGVAIGSSYRHTQGYLADSLRQWTRFYEKVPWCVHSAPCFAFQNFRDGATFHFQLIISSSVLWSFSITSQLMTNSLTPLFLGPKTDPRIHCIKWSLSFPREILPLRTMHLYCDSPNYCISVFLNCLLLSCRRMWRVSDF